MFRAISCMSIVVCASLVASTSLRAEEPEEPSCEVRLQSCQIDLTFAEESRDGCFRLVGQLEEELSSLAGYRTAYERAVADADQDGARDLDDECKDTVTGMVVDQRGCSLRQFCAASPVASDRDRARCRRLDWRNDEPERANPRDCRIVDGRCDAALAEPVRDRSCTAAIVTVSLTIETEVFPAQGATVFVPYPTQLIDLPGHGNAVQPRIDNLTGVAGFFASGDSDTDLDGLDDRLGVGLIAGDPRISIPSGPFARARFDCVPGASRVPVAADFSCESDVSSDNGNVLPSSCTVAVEILD